MTAQGPIRRTGSLVRKISPGEADSEDSLTARLNAYPHAAASSSHGDGEDLSARRKEVAYKPGRFKAVSQVVLAMNRFKGKAALWRILPATYKVKFFEWLANFECRLSLPLGYLPNFTIQSWSAAIICSFAKSNIYIWQEIGQRLSDRPGLPLNQSSPLPVYAIADALWLALIINASIVNKAEDSAAFSMPFVIARGPCTQFASAATLKFMYWISLIDTLIQMAHSYWYTPRACRSRVLMEVSQAEVDQWIVQCTARGGIWPTICSNPCPL